MLYLLLVLMPQGQTQLTDFFPQSTMTPEQRQQLEQEVQLLQEQKLQLQEQVTALQQAHLDAASGALQQLLGVQQQLQQKLQKLQPRAQPVCQVPNLQLNPFDRSSNPDAIPKSSGLIKNMYLKLSDQKAPVRQAMCDRVTDPVGAVAFDHCHKPAAHVRTADGQRVFDGLATFMTTTDQVALVVPTNSTQLQEVAPNIIELDERCKLNLTWPGAPLWDEAANTQELGTSPDTAVVIEDDSLTYTPADHANWQGSITAEAAAAVAAVGATFTMQPGQVPAATAAAGGAAGQAASAGDAAAAGRVPASTPLGAAGLGFETGSSSSSGGPAQAQHPAPGGASSSSHYQQGSGGLGYGTTQGTMPWQAQRTSAFASSAAAAYAAMGAAAEAGAASSDSHVPVSLSRCADMYTAGCSTSGE